MMYLDKIQERTRKSGGKRFLPDDVVPVRVHEDVVKLATELYGRDSVKLRAAAPCLFMPSEVTWIEWPMGDGTMALAFSGRRHVSGGGEQGSVERGQCVFFAQRPDEDHPALAALSVNLKDGGFRYMTAPGFPDIDPIIGATSVKQFEPLILAILALINSPKLVRRDPVDMQRLNKKRKAAGRYTFHNHHVVRLNVDRKSIRVGASDGGDGASRALHFVRAHLRFAHDRYILVQPHWRGDPQVGIVKPQYEVDRQTSKWSS